MNPKKLEITGEREQKIKERYGYSYLSVYDVDFLDSYEEKIISEFFPEIRHEEIRARLKKMSEFVIGDRLKNNFSRTLSSRDAVHFDSSMVDIIGDSFHFKKEYPYTETLLYHSLLHAASRSSNKNGVMEKGKKNVGLNEGITKYLAENLTGIPVPNEVDSCYFNKQVVSILVDTLGLDVVSSSYFDHTEELKNILNSLSGDSEFYDKFNRKLDTITKLETTVRKIERGEQKPVDEESLSRMKIILEKQQEALMESVFSNVILPTIAREEVDKRSYKLLEIVSKYRDVFPSVMKYVPQISQNNMVDLSDERLAAIKKELEDYGIDFKKIQESVKNIDLDKGPSSRQVKNALNSASNVYEGNTEQLKIERSSLLTPSLERELIKFVDILDMLEEEAARVNKSVSDYVEFIKASFPGIDVEREIIRIREEKKKRKDKNPDEERTQGEEQTVEVPEEIRKVIDGVKKDAQDRATSAVHTKKEEEEQVSTDSVDEKEELYGLKANFVISNLTGEVYDQRNLSIYQKAVNISTATGEVVKSSDPVSVELCEKYLENYLETFEPSEDLITLYGEEGWKDVIRSAYQKGWTEGMTEQMHKAHQEGMVKRNAVEQSISNNVPLKEDNRPVSFDEIMFIQDKFEINTDEDIKVIYGEQEVLSERTKSTVMFSKMLKQAVGKDKITEEDREVYAFIANHVINDLTTNNSVNYEEIKAGAEQLGEPFSQTIQALTSSSESRNLLENYFKGQIGEVKTTGGVTEETSRTK